MLELTLPEYLTDFSLLLIRIILGVVFVVGAKNKLTKLKKFAKNNSLPMPVAFFVATIELIAGICVVLGVFTQLASLAIILLMINTIGLHTIKWRSPYWASKGGWEYDLMILALASVVLINGAGKVSLI